MIKQELYDLVNRILLQLKEENYLPKNLEIPKYTIEVPPANIGADLASNVALLLSQATGEPTQEVAEKVISLLAKRSSLIAKVEFSSPGFLNFYLAPERFYQELEKIIAEKETYGKMNLGKGEKVLFEFVSANPTGPLHVGHGRGAAIGDSLGRIFSFLGWNVEREYYVNDIGNQIENLGKTVMLKTHEAAKMKLTEEEKEWLSSENAYRGNYLNEIAREIVHGPNLAGFGNDEQAFFARAAVRKILNLIKKDLRNFSVHFDHWVFESTFYEKAAQKRSKVEETISLLKEKNFIYEKENAQWFKSTTYGDEKDRVLIRADGRATYVVGDIAYHRNKFERKFEKLINFWGADHHGYINRIRAAIKAFGYEPDRLQIVLYQLVSLIREGKPVPMSTRAGEFVTLRQLLDEVGKDACRYFFLTRSPEAQLQFDLDLAKKQSPENPVYYIQYAHTRVAGIFREAKKQDIPYQLINLSTYQLLKEKAELTLIKKLSFFPDTLLTCVKDLSPHHLTAYLLDLANEFHRYYEKYRIITENRDLTLARLALAETVGIIIKNGLGLIGVSAPEKM